MMMMMMKIVLREEAKVYPGLYSRWLWWWWWWWWWRSFSERRPRSTQGCTAGDYDDDDDDDGDDDDDDGDRSQRGGQGLPRAVQPMTMMMMMKIVLREEAKVYPGLYSRWLWWWWWWWWRSFSKKKRLFPYTTLNVFITGTEWRHCALCTEYLNSEIIPLNHHGMFTRRHLSKGLWGHNLHPHFHPGQRHRNAHSLVLLKWE